MRHERYTLDAKSAVGTGAAFACRDFTEKTIQVTEAAGGNITATVLIEATLDGVVWLAVETLNLAGSPGQIVTLTGAFDSLRVHTTAYTSGSIVATFAGFNERAQ